MPHSIFGTFCAPVYTVQTYALITRFEEETEGKDYTIVFSSVGYTSLLRGRVHPLIARLSAVVCMI